LLALAHDRGCEGQLAEYLDERLDAGELPNIQALRERFAPDPETLPHIEVRLGSLAAYEELLERPALEVAA
jgi:hypothetical protein